MKPPKTYAEFSARYRAARKEFLENALRENGGNVIATAKAIKMHRTHLNRRIIDDKLAGHVRSARAGNKGNSEWQRLAAMECTHE